MITAPLRKEGPWAGAADGARSRAVRARWARVRARLGHAYQAAAGGGGGGVGASLAVPPSTPWHALSSWVSESVHPRIQRCDACTCDATRVRSDQPAGRQRVVAVVSLGPSGISHLLDLLVEPARLVLDHTPRLAHHLVGATHAARVAQPRDELHVALPLVLRRVELLLARADVTRLRTRVRRGHDAGMG